MQYMLLIYGDENALDDAQRQECYVKSTEYARQLNASGHFRATSPLHPTSTATSLRIRDGKWLVTDGPFAEKREQLGGFFLINARDLDEAIEISAKIPAAQWGTVEVRPVVEIPGLPEASLHRTVDLAQTRSTE